MDVAQEAFIEQVQDLNEGFIIVGHDVPSGVIMEVRAQTEAGRWVTESLYRLDGTTLVEKWQEREMFYAARAARTDPEGYRQWKVDTGV